MRPFLLLVLLVFIHELFAQNRFQDPVFDQVTRVPNLIYAHNATVIAASIVGQAIAQPLVLDFYEPTGDAAPLRPLVLVLPGGLYLPKSQNGTCEGSLRDSAVVEICTRLAKMGYVAAAVDYRLGWNPLASQQVARMATYTQAMYRGIQDARSAIRYFKKTVVEEDNPFRIDTSRIVLWGEAEGGQIALGAAYATTPEDWIDPSLVVAPPDIPAIIPAYLGNIWGTDFGVLDAAGQSLYGLPNGDTLCMPNWPGYSSDFQLCVSMAGILPSLPWISAEEVPAILFHAPNDVSYLCDAGLYNIPPPLNLGVTPVFGSCGIATQLDLLGVNQVFWDANINDCVTNNANLYNGGLEGFYPFVGLSADKGRPWQWTAPCSNNPTGATDGAFARQYLDTIFAYFAPRALAALNLGNVQSDPGGLCGTQIKGKTFLDLNQNDSIDLNEPDFPGVLLELDPIGSHVASGPTGKFNLHVPPGSYVLKVPNLPKYYAAHDSAFAISVSADSDVLQNIGFYPVAIANDLQVFLTPLTEARPGFYNAFAVKWKNVGTTALSGNVTVTVDPAYTILGSNLPANITGNVAVWDFANLNPLQSGEALLQLELLANTPLGTMLASSALVAASGTGEETPADNMVSISEETIGSYDPNDKRVFPEGPVTAEMLQENGNWLDYTIRFQNTGTASAINIHLVDTLSELLNINSLEMIGASHTMRWEVGGQGTLRWFFDNINLPDSLHNEPASHGFVRYRIQPRLPFTGLLNKTVRNFADIYFDFNTPVRTNTTETPFTETIRLYSPEAGATLPIAPNPASDFAQVAWPLGDTHGHASFRVMDAQGKQVFSHEIEDLHKGYVERISLKNWAKGIYFVQFLSKSNLVSGRFVKS